MDKFCGRFSTKIRVKWLVNFLLLILILLLLRRLLFRHANNANTEKSVLFCSGEMPSANRPICWGYLKDNTRTARADGIRETEEEGEEGCFIWTTVKT